MVDADAFQFELPCPHCDQTDLHLISLLVGKDKIACRHCGRTIDLSEQKLQDELRQLIKDSEQI